jgi:hypothetical protein
MSTKLEVLALGASYGSLLASKIALAGHNVHLVCLPDEASAINQHGVELRLPVRGRDELVVVNSKQLSGRISAGAAADVDAGRYDLVALAMQEPQYGNPEIRALLQRIADAKVPCMSIMNMPPLTYLRRIPGLDCDSLRDCYVNAAVWDILDPELVTLCSPDPQAFRPPGEGGNVLQVTLPTNFKAARFEQDSHTEMLRRLERDIAEATFEVDGEQLALPVKLRVHDSIFVPMAKWSMLLTGNYRCVQRDRMRAIRDAVHSDPAESARIYERVAQVCIALGAEREDLVPFEKYAKAAEGLAKPSSAARALAAGAANIERVDRLVATIAAQLGMRDDAIDEIVDTVESHLQNNRLQAAS